VDEYGIEVVQFSHFSVKEFLTSSRLANSSDDVSHFHVLLEPAHAILATACLGVLLRLDDRVDKHNIVDRFPLVRYAAEHWATHTQFGNVSSQLREGMEILFDPDKRYLSTWIRVYDIDEEPHGESTFWCFTPYSKSPATPLYYAALCGFHDLAEHLIDNFSQQVNSNGGFHVSPLVAALRIEDFKMAQLLYERGADIDVQGYQKTTPLHGASCSGHLKTVRWLLCHGAMPNSPNKNGRTPLHGAAARGYTEVARTLFQYKADNNIQDVEGLTPLHRASQTGKVDVARLLLEQGVDVNTRSNDGSTPLHLASEGRRLEVARLLMKYGADVGAEDNERRTPLQVALGSKMIELLSDHGPN
jgi:ankyrin repeat protein